MIVAITNKIIKKILKTKVENKTLFTIFLIIKEFLLKVFKDKNFTTAVSIPKVATPLKI